jgi:hypothetical protein
LLAITSSCRPQPRQPPGKQTPNPAARLAETLQMLREPILKEQDAVFPVALASLEVADCEAVEAVRDRTGSLLPSPGG